MKKTDDFFFAGLVAGSLGGIGILLFNVVLRYLLGVPHGTYWEAMGGLFYAPYLLKTWHAQVHGAVDAIGVSAINGVLTGFVLRFIGRDYLYIKCVALSAFSAYFLFLAVYPQTGLGKDSPITPWIALFAHTFFLGVMMAFILDRIYSFKKIQIK